MVSLSNHGSSEVETALGVRFRRNISPGTLVEAQINAGLPSAGAKRMYAVAFDLDMETLRKRSVTPVTCVLAVQDLARRFTWFPASVRDIRMLRIEENNDLLPAM